MDGLQEERGYWKLKEEALDRTRWRIAHRKIQWTFRKTDKGMNGRMKE
jgi:hypothetical protein